MGRSQDVRARHTVRCLIGWPLLGDYLENALSEVGRSGASSRR